jgi:flagellin-like hook-associated protein FlgL
MLAINPLNFYNINYLKKTEKFFNTKKEMENTKLEAQLNKSSFELKNNLEVYEKAISVTDKADMGANDIFSLLGNMRSILIKNMGGSENITERRKLKNKINKFLSEIDNKSRITFNQVPLLNGSLNINFLLLNKNYNFNLNKDLSSLGLNIQDINENIEKQDINKLDIALETTNKVKNKITQFKKNLIKDENKEELGYLNKILYNEIYKIKGNFIDQFV